MTARACAWLLALAACTSDVHLGSRGSPCDPLAGDDCPCVDTAECPEHFHCVPDANDPNTPGPRHCVAAPTCNANICSNNADSCCALDFRCYPTNCADCCR